MRKYQEEEDMNTHPNFVSQKRSVFRGHKLCKSLSAAAAEAEAVILKKRSGRPFMDWRETK